VVDACDVVDGAGVGAEVTQIAFATTPVPRGEQPAGARAMEAVELAPVQFAAVVKEDKLNAVPQEPLTDIPLEGTLGMQTPAGAHITNMREVLTHDAPAYSC